MKKNLPQVKVLLDALPYIKKHTGEIFVIKYGGSAQIDSVLKDKFAQDILLMYLMGIRPVIVHGGGNKISQLLKKLDIKSEFVDGLRVTDEATMEVVEMVLSGNINKEITALINEHGAKALGISGKDANFITATPIDMQKYGLVGNITNIDKHVITKLLDEKFIQKDKTIQRKLKNAINTYFTFDATPYEIKLFVSKDLASINASSSKSLSIFSFFSLPTTD